eukprot:7183262-Alexandrium_andersonii.AAC.1
MSRNSSGVHERSGSFNSGSKPAEQAYRPTSQQRSTNPAHAHALARNASTTLQHARLREYQATQACCPIVGV